MYIHWTADFRPLLCEEGHKEERRKDEVRRVRRAGKCNPVPTSSKKLFFVVILLTSPFFFPFHFPCHLDEPFYFHFFFSFSYCYTYILYFFLPEDSSL
jgi:hypothetical protein